MKITNLVDVSGRGWAPSGHFDALAYVDGGMPGGSGEVSCEIWPYDRKTREARELWTTMRGSFRDAKAYRGPDALPTLAVPMSLPDEVSLLEVVSAAAHCQVVDGGEPVSPVHFAQVHLRPRIIPDLALREGIDIVECDTEAMPTAGGRICLKVWHGDSIALNNGWNKLIIGVECEFQIKGNPAQPSKAAIGVSQANLGEIELSHTLHQAGLYRVICRTDAAEHVPESNEENNFAESTLEVLERRDDSRYRLQITNVAKQAKEADYSGHEHRGASWHELTVEIRNVGPYPVRAANLTCKGDGIHFASGFGTSLPGQALKPGARSKLRLRSVGEVRKGAHELDCEVQLLSPKLANPPTERRQAAVRVP